MGNSSAQTGYRESSEQSVKQSEVYKQVFDTTEGTYEAKSKAAQEAVTKYRQTMLGEKFRSQLAQQVATLAPMPEAGDANSELSRLSRERVAAWLERYQGGIAEALSSMFGLNSKYRMTQDELALFMGELKDPAHLEQKTFFTLDNWLNRVKREAQTVTTSQKEVVDRLLTGIAANQSPANLTTKTAA